MPAPIPNIPAFDQVRLVVPAGPLPLQLVTNYAIETVEKIYVVSDESEELVRGPVNQSDELTVKPEAIAEAYALRGWSIRALGEPFDTVTVSYTNAGYSLSTMVFNNPTGDLHLPMDSRGVVSVEATLGGLTFNHTLGFTAFPYARYVMPPTPSEEPQPGDITENESYTINGQARRLLDTAEWVKTEPRLIEITTLLEQGSTVILDYTYAIRPSLT